MGVGFRLGGSGSGDVYVVAGGWLSGGLEGVAECNDQDEALKPCYRSLASLNIIKQNF